MGLYAGAVGTSTIVLDETKRPTGAVVIGLGDSGDLAAGSLQEALVHGLIAYAAADEDHCGGPAFRGERPLGVSTLLIGSGQGQLSRPACVLALLRAAERAQQVLVSTKSQPRPLGVLQIIDAVEYRAFEIWHVIGTLLGEHPELRGMFELRENLELRPGVIRSTDGVVDRDWWMPLQITMTKSGTGDRTISFVGSGGRARAEASLLDANLDFVQRFVAQAVGGYGDDDKCATPSRALYELLWPIRLKRQSGEDRNLRLILDERTAAFPWELMDDRAPWSAENIGDGEQSERDPFSVRTGVVRQLIQTRFREVAPLSRRQPKALVIGDPRGDPAPGFAELLGAQQEARAVAEILKKAAFDVTPLIGDEVRPEQAIMHLFAEQWDVIYIAAHGVFEEALPQAEDGNKEVGQRRPGAAANRQKQTGIVLGAGLVLGPAVLAQLAMVPSLVFVNCCHQGRVDPEAEVQADDRFVRARRPDLAASVAVELIKLGVRAVFAAGWAVNDLAAERFADCLYENLIAGETLGESALKARRAAYELQPNGTTWGAYQCYGEPDWRLCPEGIAKSASTVRFASASEAVYHLDEQRELLSVGLARNIEGTRSLLKSVREDAETRGWKSDPKLLIAIAKSHAELGELDKAAAAYQDAMKQGDGLAIEDIEHYAILAARAAVTAFGDSARGEGDYKAACDAIAASQAKLDMLTNLIGATPEQLSLQGGCWKRLAQISSGQARTDALRKMAECHLRGMTGDDSGRYYRQLQWATARIALAVSDGSAIDGEVVRAVGEVESMAPDPADKWREISMADAKLLRAVIEAIAAKDFAPERETALVEAYRRAWKYAGSPSNLMSVLEQLDFLEGVLADAIEGGPVVASALGRIRSLLESSMLGSRGGVQSTVPV